MTLHDIKSNHQHPPTIFYSLAQCALNVARDFQTRTTPKCRTPLRHGLRGTRSLCPPGCRPC